MHEVLTANEPVNSNSPMQQPHHSFYSVRSTANHHRLIYLTQASAQIEIVLQAMECTYTVKVASRQVSTQALRGASRRQQERVIAKTEQTSSHALLPLAALRVYLLDMGSHDVNVLCSFGASWIGQQLFTCQPPYSKLFEGGGVNRGVNLLGDNHNPFLGSKSAGLHCGG